MSRAPPRRARSFRFRGSSRSLAKGPGVLWPRVGLWLPRAEAVGMAGPLGAARSWSLCRWRCGSSENGRLCNGASWLAPPVTPGAASSVLPTWVSARTPWCVCLCIPRGRGRTGAPGPGGTDAFYKCPSGRGHRTALPSLLHVSALHLCVSVLSPWCEPAAPPCLRRGCCSVRGSHVRRGLWVPRGPRKTSRLAGT